MSRYRWRTVLSIVALTLVFLLVRVGSSGASRDPEVALFLHAYVTSSSTNVNYERPELALINNSGRFVTVTNLIIETKQQGRWVPFSPSQTRRGPMQMKANERWMVPMTLPEGHVTWRALCVCRVAPGKLTQGLNGLFRRAHVPVQFQGRQQTLITREYSL